MSNQTPSPDTVIRRAIAAALKYVRVALPGKILEYDRTRLEATVQPLIQERVPTEDGSRAVDRMPAIAHVPVYFVGGGGSRLTFPVKAGDTCEIIFQSSSIDLWLALGGEVDPLDDHHHHITDAVAYVGLSDFAHARPAHATATVLEGDDVRIGDDTAALLALKSDLATLKTAISNAVIVANDGGASFKSTLLTALSSWPVGTTKVRAT
jgi:hypothetical protein